jgi:ABC-2 type transport system permease protein
LRSSPLAAMLTAKWRMAGHALASVRRESRLKVAIISTAALALLLGIFLLARLVFGLIEDFGSDSLAGGLRLSELVFGRLLAFFAAALLALLAFSNAVTLYAALFRSREMPPLVLAPLSTAEIFLGRFVEGLTFSSWATAFLGAPLLAAYGWTIGAPPSFYLAAILYFLPFVAIPAALGAIATLLAVPLLLRLHRRAAWLLAGLLIAGGALFGLARVRLLQQGLAQDAWRSWLDLLELARNPYLPSFWLAEGTVAAANGRLADASFHFLLLLANALFLVWLATLVAERCFGPAWSALAGDEGGNGGKKATARGRFSGLDGLLAFLPEPRRSLWVKDLRLFWRDPAQWSQFLLFFGILALYVANAGGQRALAGLGARWQDLGVVLNVAACLLILASLTSRFVYPLVSLEGRRWWILGLAPISLRQVVWQKFWLSLSCCALFTLSMAVLIAWRLALPPIVACWVVAAVAAATSSLCGLAVGLGSLYANFQAETPARVVSGLGGTLNFLLSALYLGFVTLTLGGALLWRQVAAPAAWGLWLPVVVLAASAAVATLLPMRLGIRHLERIDY